MAEALTKKKRIRAGHKASTTKTMGKVDDVLAADSPDASTLALLKLTLQEKLETIRVLDSEIVELLEDEAAVTTEIEQTDGYRETIRSSLLKIEKVLSKIAAPPTTTTTAPTAPATTPSALAATASTSRVKLPKLKLRPFGGELTQWTSFWESFEAAVHSNPDLTPVEKFNYLASVLERSAREAISGLSLTAANYDEAISTLKKRFGGRQKIIDRHMDALLKVGAVTSCHEVKALRRLHDLVSSHVRSLKSLGVKSESYGSLLCPVLLARLPSEMQLNVSRKVSEADWNLDQLMKVVEEEIVARERVGITRPTRRGEDKPPPTATTLVSDSGSTSLTCCYCSQPHFPSSCGVITDVEARKQSLRKSGRCFSCLRKGHLSRNCRATNRCRTCGSQYHASICTPRPRDGDRPPATQPPAAHSSATTTIETTSGLNPSAPEFSPIPSQPSLCVDANHAVLLQTALAKVYNPENPSLTRRVRIILDNGSQRSYLTQRVREELSLMSVSTQQLSIAAFGSRRAQARPCDVVRVKIKTLSEPELELDLFVVPHICDPLTAQPAFTCFREHAHLSHLNFADDSTDDAPREIDLLIGSDSYWNIVTGDVLRGCAGPIAVGTRLGWVLSGPVEVASLTSVNLVSTHTLRTDSADENIDATLKSFWELESLGVKNEVDPVQCQFSKSIQMKEGRYQVALPWREHHEPLSTNRELSRN